MNWINRFFLSLALWPAGLYEKLGADLRQLHAILETKLLMDDRRPNSLQATRRQQHNNKEISNATIGTILMSGITGFFYLFLFSFPGAFELKLTLYFGVFISLLSMMLISDFTTVLIDVRDNYILLPKPVGDRTLVLARLLHIGIHLGKIILPMSLPGLVFLAIAQSPWALLLFPLQVLLLTLFSIFLINALYILILRVTTPERFKNIIAYFQIGFAILIYGASQIVPRMMQDTDLDQLGLSGNPWLVLAPPYWFASLSSVLLEGGRETIQIAGALLAVLVPLLSIYGVMRWLAPAFNQKLAMISGSEATVAVRVRHSAGNKKGLVDRLSMLLTRRGAERTGFLFAWKMMARSREFKIRTYPSIGYFVVLLFVFLMRRGGGNAPNEMADALNSFLPVMTVYFGSMILFSVLAQMAYSEKYKAAWMFYLPPVEAPGLLISGSIKAALCQFLSAVALFSLILGVYFGGAALIPNLVLALSNQLVLILIYVLLTDKHLPFAQQSNDSRRSGQLLQTLMIAFFAVALGGLHYFVFRLPWAMVAAFVINLLVIYFLFRRLQRVGWRELRIAD